jgi:hypothetical protein
VKLRTTVLVLLPVAFLALRSPLAVDRRAGPGAAVPVHQQQLLGHAGGITAPS